MVCRDIKPENILILNEPDPRTGLPVAKLLDFGLSKHAGLGSAAKTFVGTWASVCIIFTTTDMSCIQAHRVT